MKLLLTLLPALLTQTTGRRNQRIVIGFLLFTTVLVALFSIVFHQIMAYEGRDYSYITGVYWTLTVMSTLGFGDITFTSDIGKLFSIIVLVSGIILIMIVMMVLMLLIVVMAAAALVVVMMMVMMLFLFYLLKVDDRTFHRIEYFLAAQYFNRCGNNVCFRIQFAEHFYSCLYFFRIGFIGTAQDDGSCALYLILEKFAEVSEIHFAFHNVDYGCCGIQGYACFFFYTVYSLDDVGEFTYAGRLDDDAVRVIFGDNVF